MIFNIDASTIVIIIVSLVVGLSIHEATHAYVSFKLGDTTAAEQGRVSFNPFRHISLVGTILMPLATLILFHVPILAARPVPFNPYRVKYHEYGAALMAAAGPLSNLLLAIVAALIIRVAPGSNGVVNALGIFATVNLGVFVFNMIPIPPLDGSRVLYAFAPEAVQEFMNRIEPYGFFLVFGLVLLVPAFTNLLANIDSTLLRLLFPGS